MKSGILRKSAAWCAAAFLAIQPAHASDTFHLKDGSILEGRILEDRGESYLLEIQVTPSIKDERLVAKEDIDRIEREEPDAAAFAAIRELDPIPDLLGEGEYETRITAIREFIAEHPDSGYATEAREILDSHLAEAEVIAAGGIKIGGELLAPEDRLANAYYIDSRIAETAIRRLIHESSMLSALRRFREFEEDFTDSEAWHSLLPLMRQVTTSHRNTARRMLDEYDDLIAAQESGLSRMSREERRSATNAIADRQQALENRHEEERGRQGYWLSINPYYKPALEETVRFADQEINRLESAAARPPREPSPSEIWRDAIETIERGDSAATNAAISAARAARMSDEHIQLLENLAAESQNADKAQDGNDG